VRDKYQKFTYFMNFFKMKYFNDQFEEMRKRYRERELELVFIKKLVILKQEMLIRLSNSIVQLQLADMSIVLMAGSSPLHRFYISKAGEESAYPTEDIDVVTDQQILKKLKRF
jgi:hypothetical protein